MQPDDHAQRVPTRPRMPEPTPEQIQERAYAIYQTHGSEEGQDLDDWLLTEYELKTELGGQRQSPAE